MNSSHKRRFTKNGGARAPSNVRLGEPAFAANEHSLQTADRARHHLAETSGEHDDPQSEPLPASGITWVAEKEAPQRRRTFDEVIDALQLLTVTDVCKLLRISKPTLWRLRRSGDFPDPTTVTERIFGWRRWEIDEWLASRPSSRRY
jgi:predicted DNA-binding transcriptional regulator AlpA